METGFALAKIRPAALFPINRMGIPANTQVRELAWTASHVKLELGPEGSPLAVLELKTRSSLGGVSTYEREYFERSNLFKVLKGEPMQVVAVKGKLSFSGLRPFCGIEGFFLAPAFRRSGTGRLWYREQVEPFLAQSGLAAATTFGNCWGDNATGFWRKTGFSSTLIGIDYDGSEEVQHCLLWKLMQEKVSP